jgi:hypothetical protein
MREDFLSWCREQRRIAAERYERLETGKMVVFDQRGEELVETLAQSGRKNFDEKSPTWTA